MDTAVAIVISLGATTFFVVLWSGIIFLVGYASGWQKLAKTYLTNSFPDQPKSCNCILGKSSIYTGIIQYASTREGLYLKTIKLFSVGHKPLFIPWSDIENYEAGNSSTSSMPMFYKAKFNVKGFSIMINQDVKALQTQYF